MNANNFEFESHFADPYLIWCVSIILGVFLLTGLTFTIYDRLHDKKK